MRRILRQLVAWAGRPESRALTLAANTSAQQFKESDCVDQVRQVLDRTGAQPARLKLEVTEGLFLNRSEIR